MIAVYILLCSCGRGALAFVAQGDAKQRMMFWYGHSALGVRSKRPVRHYFQASTQANKTCETPQCGLFADVR